VSIVEWRSVIGFSDYEVSSIGKTLKGFTFELIEESKD
jgi:hypothetical protein